MQSSIAKPDRVLLALSGGVDSAVAACILMQQGFSVEAAVIHFSPAHQGTVEAARRAAQELSIPLAVLDAEPAFERDVISSFCEAYAGGRTPNPCVLCNPAVKFAALAVEADRRGIRFIASGHYARVEEKDGFYYVRQAASAARDQSYMLYRLPQAILSRLCLPVGEFQKSDIRAMANDLKLSSAEAPDSQEICFIPTGDYPTFLAQRGIKSLPGRFIGPNGEDLGQHKGVANYTIGQRKGLGLSLGRPAFVRAILPDGNIRIAWGKELFAETIALRNIFTTDIRTLRAGEHYDVKIRSAAKPTACFVETSSAELVTLRFAIAQRAPAPGQHAVLYEGGLVIGGGEIERATYLDNL